MLTKTEHLVTEVCCNNTKDKLIAAIFSTECYQFLKTAGKTQDLVNL